MDIVFSSIGFIGVVFLFHFGFKMIFKPPKSRKEWWKRCWQLLPATLLIAIGLSPLLLQKEETRLVTLDQFLGITNTDTIACQYTWKKTRLEKTDADKQLSASRIIFSYRDSQDVTHTIILLATTLYPTEEKKVCETDYNGRYSSETITLETQPVELHQCEFTNADKQQVIMAGFQRHFKGSPVVISVTTTKENKSKMLAEAECIVNKLPISATSTSENAP